MEYAPLAAKRRVEIGDLLRETHASHIQHYFVDAVQPKVLFDG
jgi:hypothetical protein